MLSWEKLPSKRVSNMALTDAKIRALRPPEKGKILKVLDDRGLYVFVYPSGRRVFYARCTPPSRKGQPKKEASAVRLGEYGVEIGLAEARRMAEEVRSRVKRGLPPREQDVPTFERVARQWLELRRAEITAAHADDIWRRLEKDVLPAIGAIPLPEITPPQLLDVLRPVSERAPETAKRLRQYLSAVFQHGIVCGLVNGDPAAHIGKALRAPQKKHLPAITGREEFSTLMRTIHGYWGAPITRLALLFAAATAVRPGNIRLAEWGEIDLEARTWAIPGKKMKSRRPHTVPLSPFACRVLEEAAGFRRGRYVFPGRPNRPMSENTLNAALKALGYDGRHCAHGFRSSFSSLANEEGAARPDVIERALAHSEKDEVRAAYNRAVYMQEKRELFDWWGGVLEEVLSDSI